MATNPSGRIGIVDGQMSRRSFVALGVQLLSSAVFLPLCVAADTAPASRPAAGPRIVCFGDSITKGGYPQILGKTLGVETINAGVGGNTSGMGLKRIQADVLDKNPSVVVVLFGTNDCRIAEPKVAVPVDKYQANLEEIIDRSQRVGAKVVLMTLPPINPEPYFKRHKKEPFDAAGGLEKVVAQYRTAALKAAEVKKTTVVDLNQLLGAKKMDEWLSADGVHPSPKGYELIASYAAEKVRGLVK